MKILFVGSVCNTIYSFQLEPFHEHVFLKHHIEDWCPTTGPVRHFMEVVCVGLQRNPYITVEKKVSHKNVFVKFTILHFTMLCQAFLDNAEK